MRGSARDPTNLCSQQGVNRAVARFTPLNISHTSFFEIFTPPHRLPSPSSVGPDCVTSGQVLKWSILAVTSTHEPHRALHCTPGGGLPERTTLR